MTVRERARRASRIVAARKMGATWAQISAEFGISITQAQDIVADWESSDPDDGDGRDSLTQLVDVLRQACQDFAVIAQRTEHDACKIGALKQLVETSNLRWQVERAAGLVPRHPAGPRIEAEMRQVFVAFAELLRRHGIGDEVLREFLELAEQTMRGGVKRPLELTGGGQVG